MDTWEQTLSPHDPLCALPAAKCVGCLLVELRSDATYESDPVDKQAALDSLIALRDLVQAHIDDVVGVER